MLLSSYVCRDQEYATASLLIRLTEMVLNELLANVTARYLISASIDM
jgi:hypothetical protein